MEVYFGVFGSDSPRPEQILRVLIVPVGQVVERWDDDLGWRAHQSSAVVRSDAHGRYELVGYDGPGTPVQVSWEQVKPYLRAAEEAQSADRSEDQSGIPSSRLAETMESLDLDLRRFLLNLLIASVETRMELLERLEQRAETPQLVQLLRELEDDPTLCGEVVDALQASNRAG